MASTPAPLRAARGLPFLVALSGAAALVYESLWMRSFGLIFGGTTSGGGDGAGRLHGRPRDRQRPRRAPRGGGSAAGLRAARAARSGAAALLTLPLLRALPWAYGALVARGGLTGAAEHAGHRAPRGARAAAADDPAGRDRAARRRVPGARGTESCTPGFGRLYLLNTLGGAVGRGARAVRAGAGARRARRRWSRRRRVSLFVGERRAALVARDGPLARCRRLEPTQRRPGDAATSTLRPPALGLALAFASGAATFGVEVLWTRSYALVIGSSVYAFNLMLLAVLLGIALGSAVYAARSRAGSSDPARCRRRCCSCWPASPCWPGAWAIGRLPIVSLAALELLPGLLRGSTSSRYLALCLATLLPVTVALGLTLPAAAAPVAARAPRGAAAGGRPPLRLEHGRRHRGRARRRPRARSRASALQRPYLVFAALLVGGGAVGARRRARRSARRGPRRRRRGSRRRRGRWRSSPRYAAVGPGRHDVGRAPLRARVDPPARLARAPRRLAARAAHAALLPRGRGGGRGGLRAEGRRAPLPLGERQDRRRQRHRGRGDAEVHRARADAAAPGRRGACW